MSTVIKILAILIAIAIGTGFYYRIQENYLLGDRIIGLAVLASAFILMPLFLYHRWKGKRLKDYTLSEENLNKMKGRKRH
jgi:membrane protein YdbS with pleckstrin-like domain